MYLIKFDFGNDENVAMTPSIIGKLKQTLSNQSQNIQSNKNVSNKDMIKTDLHDEQDIDYSNADLERNFNNVIQEVFFIWIPFCFIRCSIQNALFTILIVCFFNLLLCDIPQSEFEPIQFLVHTNFFMFCI